MAYATKDNKTRATIKPKITTRLKKRVSSKIEELHFLQFVTLYIKSLNYSLSLSKHSLCCIRKQFAKGDYKK